MNPDLEGLSGAPPINLPPITGAVDCPSCGFSIGPLACRSRQVEFTKGRPGVCEADCSNFDAAAHEDRLKTMPKPTPAPREDAEEECPMDEPKNGEKPTLDRPLPKGAKVLPSGVVKVGSNAKRPCPRCDTGWVNKYGPKDAACRGCLSAALKTPPEQLAKARQAKAAKKSPEPKAFKAGPGTPFSVSTSPKELQDLANKLAAPISPEEKAKFSQVWEEVHSGTIEDLAQDLATKVRARAAEILGLEVAP